MAWDNGHLADHSTRLAVFFNDTPWQWRQNWVFWPKTLSSVVFVSTHNHTFTTAFSQHKFKNWKVKKSKVLIYLPHKKHTNNISMVCRHVQRQHLLQNPADSGCHQCPTSPPPQTFPWSLSLSTNTCSISKTTQYPVSKVVFLTAKKKFNQKLPAPIKALFLHFLCHYMGHILFSVVDWPHGVGTIVWGRVCIQGMLD